MASPEQHASNLKAARAIGSIRNAKNTAKNAKKNIKAAVNVGALMTYIDPFMDWLFGIALVFAIIKDVLNYVLTALIAAGGIGELLIILFTIICSIAIGFIMLLTGSNGKTKSAKALSRFLVLLFGSFLETIPGVDLFPFETFSVIIIVWMTLVERKRAAEEGGGMEPEPAVA